MIDYPYLKEQPSTRQTLSVFRGLNRNTRIAEGEFSEMENMTSDHYPVLSPRGKRGTIRRAVDSDAMFHVPGGATFYTSGNKLMMRSSVNDKDVQIADNLITTQIGRQFALMGKALILVPDRKWLDLDNPFDGLKSMGAIWKGESGEVTISLCKEDGAVYTVGTVGKEPPSNPKNLDLWLDTFSTPNTLRQYSSHSGEWVSIPTTYLKISGLIGHPFSAGDAVTLTGIESHDAPRSIGAMKGAQLVEAVGSDYIVITGITDAVYTQDCGAYPLKIAREVPNLDFIVEAGNRLWGCYSLTNEIYASKLGDFKNWNVFSGLSTDSWVGNVGSSGHFTGAVNHGGHPVFYKENFKHKVWPSSTGAHQITSTPCMGVEKKSEHSLALYNGQLLYLSPQGVCVDDGSGPVLLGQQLGDRGYHYGVAAVHGNKYYICMTDSDKKRQLYVYDLQRQLWHCEGEFALSGMASAEEHLHAVGGGYLWDLTGREGTLEETLPWRVRTGDLMMDSPDRKYITRLTLQLELEPGSKLEIYVRYDHEKQWQKLGMTYGRKLGSFSLPVRPRRCDHLQLELRGQGMGKVYSITKTLEEGSELP